MTFYAGENLADSGGLKAAYIAYNDLLNLPDFQDILLPDLNFTSQQLFFISFAQVFMIHS